MTENQKTNIKITIEYDGSKFYGFQRQKNDRTVQEELETGLTKIFNEEIKIKSCGRTDSGVHALMHVSNFYITGELKIPIKKLPIVISNILPHDIFCLNAEIVPEKFNSRRDAKCREYLYVIHNTEIKSPFYRKKVWQIGEKIPVKKLKKTLNYIKGTHDFTSFCVNTEGVNPVKTILNIKIKTKKDKIFVFIKGYAFLHKMIRMILGAGVEIALNKNIKPSKIKEVLELKSRRENMFSTAPADGLYLYKVTY